jgi:hypothetical protein
MAEALAVAGTVVGAVGTLVSAESQATAAKAAGKDANRVAKWEAAQMERNAGQERAAAQREAIEERRQGRLAVSRARALAGASGAGVSDPTVTNILADLASQGETNALTALWEGEESARNMEFGAAGRRYEGSQAQQAGAYTAKASRRAGYMSAVGTLLEGGSDFYTKYNDPFYSPSSTGDGTAGRTRLNWG